MSCDLGDFQPINDWEVDYEGKKFEKGWEIGSPKYIIDLTTGKKYINESIGLIRVKNCCLTIITPCVHIPAGILNIVYRIAKVFSCYHFWDSSENDGCTECAIDAARIPAQPFSIIGLEFAAIYGTCNPYDGRKLYATIERTQYGRSIIAPCFQPDPKEHLLGGDINAKDQF